jgi:uncharacterized protein
MNRRGAFGTVGAGAVRVVVYVIQLYRHMVSPLRPPTCRFIPTCSQYAVDALTEYGLFRGGWMAVVRVAKCAPWHPGGWDPIPEPKTCEETSGAGRIPVARGESEFFV